MNTRNEQDPERSDDGTGSVPAQRRSVPIVEHRIDSRELFAATREITIAHGADVYRLRLTAQNKLILTK